MHSLVQMNAVHQFIYALLHTCIQPGVHTYSISLHRHAAWHVSCMSIYSHMHDVVSVGNKIWKQCPSRRSSETYRLLLLCTLKKKKINFNDFQNSVHSDMLHEEKTTFSITDTYINTVPVLVN